MRYEAEAFDWRLVAWLARRAARAGGNGGAPTMLEVNVLRWLAQGATERRNRDAREGTLKLDRRLAQVLAFSGRGE